MRQYKFFIKFITEFNADKIRYYAASLLSGAAAKYCNQLEIEPKKLVEFKEIMNEKFGNKGQGKTLLYKIIMNRKQSKNEKTKEFIKEKRSWAKETKMEDEFLVLTILNNMIKEKRIWLPEGFRGKKNVFKKIKTFAS